VTGAPREKRSPFGILVTMPPAELAKLHGLLHECGAEVFTASTCVEADRALNLGPSIRAIFSTRWLPDGGFQDLVRMGRRCPEPRPLILFLPQIDGGWIDLLEAGACDLVVEPYRRESIQRVIAELARYTSTPAGR